MKHAPKIALAVVALLCLGGCVAGSIESGHAASGGMLSQFMLGLWHGIIAPATLILEVIDRAAPQLLPWKILFYEAKAHSAAYDVGFYVGIAGSPVVVWSRRR